MIFNTNYYGKAVSGDAYPWCCAFVWDIFRMCNASSLFYGGQKTAYCPTAESWYKGQVRFYSNTQGEKGDLVFFDFNGKGVAGHIGFVKSKNADGSYQTIEGNTSVTSNDNGGAVMERTRTIGTIRGFGRPAYTAEVQPTQPTQQTGGEEEMVCLYQVDGKGAVRFFDGTKIHALTNPDELEVLNNIYKANTGKDIPFYNWTSAAPWHVRLSNAINRGE